VPFYSGRQPVTLLQIALKVLESVGISDDSISAHYGFFRTLKNDCTRRILVSFRRGTMRGELALFMRWYNGHRPRSSV